MSDWSFVEIARLFERKQATAAAELALESRQIADGWMAYGGVGSYVNKSCGFGFDQPVTEAQLDELEAFFCSRGVEPKVELSPFAPASLLESLDRRGFALREFVNVLYRPLRAEEDLRRLPLGWPEGVRIERVDPTDDAAVLEFVQVSSSGFMPEGEPLSEVFLQLGLKSARHPTADAYVARKGTEAVGAGGCETSGGLTSLFGTSVKPAFRRQGIQQALIAARLARGQELGSTLAVIASGPGIPTERNATRLGFAMAYSRVALVKHGEGLTPSP
ncbi:GNAT family N-acetyltransferase [Stigmatella sp. ncwal1]|uniref:GNAT family N-acetyltransferase n=1 Tax=Stigmatella ashevillensis TaxID=2995309 RepID=A0ABT5DEY0_9BACT|nr:GNAT family N-acetyltransferase [Stigmatella ashevillena]MDC0712230.1 GNAT family N-acetyltransferase [Stigmatella ashevillena]